MNQRNSIVEPGSNYFELIEFTVTRPRKPDEADADGLPEVPMRYGVNVAKVREVIRLPEIVPCLTTCPEVLGVINLRGLPIPAIHLAKALGYEKEKINPSCQMIVTEFMGRTTGFVVAATHRIRRVSWDKILPPSSEMFKGITGMMVLKEGEFLFMIDFEDVLAKIDRKSAPPSPPAASPQSFGAAPQSSVALRMQGAATVLVVDDSPVARKAVSEIVRELHLNVCEVADGEAAWTALNDPSLMTSAKAVSVIICDIEMPRLDGFSLVKRIRSDEKLRDIPIVMHSSLSGEANRKLARDLGANGFVGKFNRREIIEALKEIVPVKLDL